MTQWILKLNGEVVTRCSCCLKSNELAVSNEAEANKRAAFDASIKSILGDLFTTPQPVKQLKVDLEDDPEDESFDPTDFELETSLISVPEADAVDANGKPIFQAPITDSLINAEVLLPTREDTVMAKVLHHSLDEPGRVIGAFHENPILNMLVYTCELPDGTTKEYAANIIAENVLYEADPDGYFSYELKAIVDHKRDDQAVSKANKYVANKHGQKKLRPTTVGW